MTDPYPRPDQAYTLCGTHAVTGVETEVFCGVLPDAAPLAGALTRLGVTFAVAPLRVAAPDPQATGRVPQLVVELAAIAESIGLAVQLDDRWRESNLDGEPATSEMHEARTRLHGARGDLLALADRLEAESQ